METLMLTKDIHAFGLRVSSFPKGIGEAFNGLIKAVPGGDNRSCYGISYMDAAGNIVYFAAIEEQQTDGVRNFKYERYTIPRGQYLAVTVQNWLQKTDTIKNIFHEMMQDERFKQDAPCIEWYKDDREMVCMLQANPVRTLHCAVGEAAGELESLLAALTEVQMNTIPFDGSWTAAQLAVHIAKSNFVMAQAMQMPGTVTARDPAERVEELKSTFLNFSIKFNTPGFIAPEVKSYEKDDIISMLQRSTQQLQHHAEKANMAAIIHLPALGEMTKTELLHFVLYHTQRHTHQLKNILLYV
jgi:predicted transcriptional regulator YdeE